MRNMREEYLNEGADAEMLEELKTVYAHIDLCHWMSEILTVLPRPFQLGGSPCLSR